MLQILFMIYLWIAAILRAPLSIFLVAIKNVHPLLRKRLDFERSNLVHDLSRSFKKDFLVADYCFEVSSEGELEQVRPLIEMYLKKQKRVEILFASPSVESKCLKLAQDHIDLIRLLRLPLMTFFPIDFLFFQSPWQWVSAPKIIFCRYDFYPELLMFKFFNKKLVLVSATSKKHSWFKEQVYSLFDVIVAANKAEEDFFKNKFPHKKIFSFDFRVPRIFERVKMASHTLDRAKEIESYLLFLNNLAAHEKIILGSAWVSDLPIFKNPNWENVLLAGQVHVLLVPHSLSPDSIQGLKDELQVLLPKVPVYEISQYLYQTPKEFPVSLLNTKPGIVLLNLGGILCELYTLFSFAYVGGGYERSIHSVLEPYLSGPQVACGPLIHRSTEYDFIKEVSPHEIHLLKDAENFYDLFSANATYIPNKKIRHGLEKNSGGHMEIIMNEIESC